MARLRASDRDRDVISDVLGTAYAEGRLTPAELDERSDAVAQARTLSELPAIIDDLIAPSPTTTTHPVPVVARLIARWPSAATAACGSPPRSCS